jgi:MYND finger
VHRGGGAGCSVEHPVISGSPLCSALTAALNLLHAVAAARGSAVGEGPVVTLPELRGVLVSDAGIAEANADALLAHLRRYAHLLQLMRGAQTMIVLEVLVMLQAPLRCVTEAPLWCAKCWRSEVYGQTRWCSRCQCVRYCSKKCQTDDWRGGHNRLCRALAALRSGSNATAMSSPSQRINMRSTTRTYARCTRVRCVHNYQQ